MAIIDSIQQLGVQQLGVQQLERKIRFPIDDLVVSLFKECTPKLLVVADGTLSFSGADFGLSDFVNTLKNTVIHGMSPIVKTAHRGATAADYTNFTFTSSTLSKNKYDVLFLFGYNSGGSLAPSEASIIEQFMNDGGGVFATGDHATLGKQLCGDIPRVRQMRRWNGPTAGGADRISTNDPGPDNDFEFSDQSDVIPQKIYPAYTGTPASSQPHALLQHPVKKIIEVLPDHPHESECTIPTAAELGNVSEWPKDSSGVTVSPQIVALSMSYGGGFTSPTKQPISAPRSFGAIGAYDGHKANVGRISTDATWHHFININLINTGSGPGLAGNPDAYDRVGTYFGNIANWLMPKKVRRCLRWPLVITLKRLYPIAEFLPDIVERELDVSTLLEIGRETKATLARFVTSGVQQEVIEDLIDLHSDKLAVEIAALRNDPKDIVDAIGQRMSPVELIEQAVLGALTISAERAIPSDEDAAANLKKIGGVEGLDKAAEKTVREALALLGNAMRKGRGRLDMLLEAC